MPGGKHILGKKNNIKFLGTAKVGDRGQIVIPKEARDFYEIRPGDTLLILGQSNKGLIVTRSDTMAEIANQIFDTEEEV